jgi:integrase
MSTKVKVVLHQGHLKLRFTRDRKSYYQSLGLGKLLPSYWNAKKQQVRSSHSDHERLNTAIQTELARALSSLPRQSPRYQRGGQPLLMMIKEIIEKSTELRNSTRIKYQTILAKLTNYLKSVGKEDITLNQFDLDHVKALHSFMRDPGCKERRMTVNTTNNYHKVISHFIDLCKNESRDTSQANPYRYFKLPKNEKLDKKTLSLIDIDKLKFAVINNNILHRTRLVFHFQYLSGGMRISDLLLLRFSNLINGRIVYNMYKTGSSINHLISPLCAMVLGKYLNLDFDQYRRDKSYSMELQKIRDSYFIGIDNQIKEMAPLSVFIPEAPKQFLEDTIKLSSELSIYQLEKELSAITEFVENNGYLKFAVNRQYNLSAYYMKHKERLDDIKLQLTEQYNTREVHIKESICSILTKYGTDPKTKNDFVFDFLQGIDIPLNRSHITPEHQRIMHSRTVAYNTKLKKVQRELEISAEMKSHLARTGFVNIMISMGVSTATLMEILGHSSLAVTNSYVSVGFSSKSKDDALSKIGKI